MLKPLLNYAIAGETEMINGQAKTTDGADYRASAHDYTAINTCKKVFIG